MTGLASQTLARDIASRLHHRASFICPQFADPVGDLQALMATDLTLNKENFLHRREEMLESYGYPTGMAAEKPFAYADGIAIIPIHGMLINRYSGSWGYMTGYNFIRNQLNFALADEDVKLIVFDINSGGGIASGCSELSQEIFDSRAVKPSLSVVDARCYSAAYFLGSAATKMIATPSGGLGSIGAVSMHVDMSEMIKDEGFKITFIKFGDQKTDGNAYERLSARAKATIQRDVDYHGSLFVQAVARNRGISEEDVIATEAACFLPPEALELGLIDDVLTPDTAVSQFYNDCYDDEEGEAMTVTPAAPKTETAAVAPVAMTPAEIAALVAKGVTEAMTAEKTRTSGIRTCDEAKGREALASHLADNTDLTIDAAKGILAAAPKEAPAPKLNARSPLHTAMAATPNPDVGGDGEGDGAGLDGEVLKPGEGAARILAAYGQETGRVIELKPRAA